MSKVAKSIYRAIQEGRWIDIIYKNDDRKTHFWISVNDIEPERKVILCDVYNIGLDNSFKKNWTIYFDKIISAQVIEGTYVESNDILLKDMDEYPEKYRFLEYDSFQQSVLDYYLACFREDTTPFQNNLSMVEGIDNSYLEKHGKVKLNSLQFNQVMEIIIQNLKNSKDINSLKIKKLSLNLLSIKTKRGLFSIVSRELLFDISNQSLILDEKLNFNSDFLYSRTKTISFTNYFNFNVDTFVADFDTNKKEYTSIIDQNLYPGEGVDTRPYIFELQKNYLVNLEKEYDGIEEMRNTSKMTAPINAFFGGLTRRNLGRKKHPIILLNDLVNIDQLRVIFNSMSNPVTYVQGPPGTGKTQTILNVLVSVLYNDFTALVTSNNNQPVDNIIDNLRELRHMDQEIPFPILRLGNYDAIKDSIRHFNDLYWKYKDINYSEENIIKIEKWVSESSVLVDILDEYEEKEAYEEELVALNKLEDKMKGNLRGLPVKDRKNKILNIIQNMGTITNEEVISKIIIDSDILETYLFHFSLKQLKLIDKVDYKDIKTALIFDKNEKITNKKVAKFKRIIRDDNILNRLLKVFPIILSTNLSSCYIGGPNPNFDITIMDEAGQCNPATSLIPIIRGKRLLLVGDTNQLQPIVGIEDRTNRDLQRIYRVSDIYNYKENSILHIMQNTDRVSKFILLKYHYRCDPKIIGFSNAKYYENSLIIKTQTNKNSLKLKHVDSVPDSKNVSLNEIASIIREIETSNTNDIGIVTPFRAQSNEIEKRLKEFGHKDISVGTIHTFQGDEKEKIIFSLAITDSTYQRTFDWVKNNRELINVATTRAKKELVMICDTKQVIKHSTEENNIYELMKYIKTNGEYEITDDSTDIFRQGMRRGKKLNSEFEEEFLETIKQILSLQEGLKIESKMRVADVLEVVNVPYEDMQYFLQSHFDFVIYSKKSNLPLLAIELNGIEHYSVEAVKQRDEKKKKICVDNNFKLLIIPNEYVRRYELIKDEMINILK